MRITTDKYHENKAIPLAKYIRQCVESASDHFGLGLMQIYLLLTKICAKKTTIPTFSFPMTLICDLKFASLVTLVQHYVSTKLEVSKVILFQENRRQGMDRQT